MAKYICECCGKEYISKKKKSRWCSWDCRRKAGSIEHKCDCCGKTHKVINYNYQRYLNGEIHHLCCSRACADIMNRTQAQLICEHCGKPFNIYNCFRNIQKYCSRSCYEAARRQSLRNNSSDNCYKAIRDYIRDGLATWRRDMLSKFKYTCCLTGVHNNLVIHHCVSVNTLLNKAIEEIQLPLYDKFSDYTDEQLNSLMEHFLYIQGHDGINVCITQDVHKQFHKQYGYGNNTYEQWKEFVTLYNNQ